MDITIGSKLSLNTGTKIPRLGLGLFKTPDGITTEEAVKTALSAGYRHLDTASIYKNEASVGKAVNASGISRSEIFITTKLWNEDQGYDKALKAFDSSLEKLDTGYIDLYLIHWPVPGKRLESWKALERLYDEGLVKAIGVSNYMKRHLVELLYNCRIKPAVNQIELHPFNYGMREDEVRFCRKNDILVEAYSPLTKGVKLSDPRLQKLASRYYKTAAHILIRWALQENLVVLPKSEKQERIYENAGVYDFILSSDDMLTLNAMNENFISSWDPTNAP